ncbi:MAG: hypothetical protein HY720_13385 [Planctomycetes bacterium]|nr:hypothetical protein [Planctomycetota bacterium]
MGLSSTSASPGVPARNQRIIFFESDQVAPATRPTAPLKMEVKPLRAEDRLAEVLERALALEKTGRLLDAVESFSWVERHGKSNGAPEAKQARDALDRINADPAARARLEEEVVKREIGILMGWARTHEGIGKLKEARGYYERIVIEHPNRPEAAEAARAIEEIDSRGP